MLFLLLIKCLCQGVGITRKFWISSLQSLGKCGSILVGSQQFLHLLQISNLELYLCLLSKTAMTSDEVFGT